MALHDSHRRPCATHHRRPERSTGRYAPPSSSPACRGVDSGCRRRRPHGSRLARATARVPLVHLVPLACRRPPPGWAPRRDSVRSTPSRTTARATANASIWSDVPGWRSPWRDWPISAGATRTTRSPAAISASSSRRETSSNSRATLGSYREVQAVPINADRSSLIWDVAPVSSKRLNVTRRSS